MTRRGFPHSDIPGSKLVCSSPRRFAAYRVLHRLLAPRHSPYALSSLTIGIETDTCGFRRTHARQSLLSTLTKNTASFVDQKNYRLQDIQLSKNSRGTSSHRTPLLAHVRGPCRPTPFARAPSLSLRRHLSLAAPRWRGLPAEAAASAAPGEGLVENTGLEPVTSWLQTRRSPS